MPVDTTDPRLTQPLAADLVVAAGSLYDHIGRRGPRALLVPLGPADQAEEVAHLLPFAHRVDDVTRLTARLIECLVTVDVDDELDGHGAGEGDLLARLVARAEGAAQAGRPRAMVSGALLIASGGPAPRMLRDQWLSTPAEFAALPERLTAPTFAASLLALRAVTGYVLGCFRLPEMSCSQLLSTVFEGDLASASS